MQLYCVHPMHERKWVHDHWLREAGYCTTERKRGMRALWYNKFAAIRALFLSWFNFIETYKNIYNIQLVQCFFSRFLWILHSQILKKWKIPKTQKSNKKSFTSQNMHDHLFCRQITKYLPNYDVSLIHSYQFTYLRNRKIPHNMPLYSTVYIMLSARINSHL